MNPQKLLVVDRRVVIGIRTTGLIISLLLALFCVLIFRHTLTPSEHFYRAACLPCAACFTIIGLALALWNPYTLTKVKFYTTAYIVLGGVLSSLVVGFPTYAFLSWLMLIVMVGVYLRLPGAIAAYLAMVASLIVWIGWHAPLHNFNTLFTLGFSAFAVGGISYVIMNMWRVTSDTVRKLETSNRRENVEHAQMTSLVNSMADGVIAVDGHVKVVLYNGAALNILDLNGDMKGRQLKRVLPLFDANGQPVDAQKLVQETTIPTSSRDYVLHYSDGSTANLYLSIAPVHLGYGASGGRGYVLLVRDITREKSLEEERDEFISVVSHELRTPIAITEGNISNAQFVADQSGDIKPIRMALKGAHEQVVFLAGLVNDLSTLSRAERGVLQVEVADIDPHGLVKELASDYRQQAVDKGLELKTDIGARVGKLSSSQLYVREVLQNFVTNAIKYTEKGSVTIGATADPKGIRFTIRDTGIGISKSDQEKIFDKFFRSEDYRTRQNNGTGLGLYVTMKLARLLHAEISVKSELNHGSTFTIFIPNLQTPTPVATQR